MLASSASMPSTQRATKLLMPSASRMVDSSSAKPTTGFSTLSSRWPCEAAKVIVELLPKTRVHTMVSDSTWVGLTLPGMIDEPGSFSGSLSSPKPARGPEPSRRMSLAIL